METQWKRNRKPKENKRNIRKYEKANRSLRNTIENIRNPGGNLMTTIEKQKTHKPRTII